MQPYSMADLTLGGHVVGVMTLPCAALELLLAHLHSNNH